MDSSTKLNPLILVITMDIFDHLDNLNDIVLEYTKEDEQLAHNEVIRYCTENDLDIDGFAIEFIGEAFVVDIQ